ncbi:m-phase inducer phosphatase [Coemansia sp. RSA 1822]|nr:m-phase inducer phosphatase [Coemansia sp. RSA 638]KAJ2123910.1 m-phase inducer phosphatase [Coemansia sp. RSA 720]KAJ2544059.1 m-phase inducer phosphatase [Coemansia sp. RSA 1853]KAJ2559134.1 m-phase inducer phosphatase [Coemansia sp. RSA 1822]
MNTVSSERVSSYMRKLASPNPFAGESVGHSPVAGLAKELNSSLHLDTSTPSSLRPPVFEPFRATSPEPQRDAATPLLLRSRKRVADDMGASASPTAMFWSRSQGARWSKTAESPCANNAKRSAMLLFRRESVHTDDDSSFDDDGSLTRLPKMKGPSIKTILEDKALDVSPQRPLGVSPQRPLEMSPMRALEMSPMRALEMTPLRSQSRMKRARSQTAVPSFLSLTKEPVDLLGADFSPSARMQPECHLLPCFTAPTDSIMRIEPSTMGKLLQGGFSHLYDEQIVVDCRFPYEYDGGHIAGAVNAPTASALERLLLDRPISDKRIVVVLHCEYSVQRAPSMACLLRRRDREVNMHKYPYLHYPEIYVLKGGYRQFYSSFKAQCEPQNYVEMNDEQFAVDCRERMLQFNRQFKRTKSMNDAALARSYSATVAGSALFMASPTSLPQRSSSSSSLPTRARRMGRTQSARPGINLIDFSQI